MPLANHIWEASREDVAVHRALQQEEDGRWSVWEPQLLGCVTWGDTQEEALANMQEAVEGYVERLITRSLPEPPSVEATDDSTVTVHVVRRVSASFISITVRQLISALGRDGLDLRPHAGIARSTPRAIYCLLFTTTPRSHSSTHD